MAPLSGVKPPVGMSQESIVKKLLPQKYVSTDLRPSFSWLAFTSLSNLQRRLGAWTVLIDGGNPGPLIGGRGMWQAVATR